jgi:hypothetical protein
VAGLRAQLVSVTSFADWWYLISTRRVFLATIVFKNNVTSICVKLGINLVLAFGPEHRTPKAAATT